MIPQAFVEKKIVKEKQYWGRYILGDMTARGFKCFEQKVLVVGPIYDQVEKFSSHPDWLEKHDIIIFNGNLSYPNEDLSQVRARLRVMDRYLENPKVIYNLGDQDLILMKRLWETNQASDIHHWLQGRTNVIILDFAKSQSHTVVTGGGVLPQMARGDLWSNLETSFVSNLDGRPWHDSYGGSVGYVISNNPLSDQKPKFHRFSLQMGTNYNPQATVYAVQVDYHGIGEIFSL